MKFMTYKKVGGMHHWRVGRFGGSFYIAKTAKKAVKKAVKKAYFDTLPLPVIDIVDHDTN